MSMNAEKLLDDYVRWIKDKTVLRDVNGEWVEITTPYLDRHNDCLQIYLRNESGGLILTDDAYTITDLTNSGCSLDKPKRQELLKTTLAGFGVQLSPNNQLTVHATPENFPLKKHNLVQAMLAVNDLFYLAAPYTQSLFYEDVMAWLDESDVRYTPNCKFTGKSGYDHMFDFVIPKSRKEPERIIQAVNNPKKDAVEALMFKWLDTKDTRPSDARLYAFLNDGLSPVSPAVLDAFRNYGAEPVIWTRRHDYTLTLAS